MRSESLTFAGMGRIMAIDYGTKRVGIAVTDPGRMIATGVATVQAKEVMDFLAGYFSKEEVDIIVVGEPRTLANRDTHGTAPAAAFAKELAKKFPGKKIERMDERFTSKMAFRSLLESGAKKKNRGNKALLDEISATIMLQDYLASLSR